jgi:hypothetical protein
VKHSVEIMATPFRSPDLANRHCLHTGIMLPHVALAQCFCQKLEAIPLSGEQAKEMYGPADQKLMPVGLQPLFLDPHLTSSQKGQRVRVDHLAPHL